MRLHAINDPLQMYRAFSTWPLFFAAILTAWVGLFAMALDMAASGAAAELGPGMGWTNWLALTLAGQYRALCLTLSAADPSRTGLAIIFAMWALMSIAMMAPTAVPLLKTYRDFTLANAKQAPTQGFWTMLAGYLLVWIAFAAVATVGQNTLVHAALLSTHGLSQSALLSAALLLAAGLYQFTPLKNACLTACRTPMAYFMSNWQSGPGGAFKMGLHHGAVCVGCCWALMLLAFVGGTMNLVWMGLAMTLMIIEKLSFGRYVTHPIGAMLVATSGAIAAQSLIA